MGGIEPKHKTDPKVKGMDFLGVLDDPLINLDYLCVSMILQLKSDLLEGDLGMCLSYFFNYPEPENPDQILKYAIKIKEKFRDSS